MPTVPPYALLPAWVRNGSAPPPGVCGTIEPLISRETKPPARARRLSLNTVYTHLRRVKDKTRCGRMLELIRKLNDLQGAARIG